MKVAFCPKQTPVASAVWSLNTFNSCHCLHMYTLHTHRSTGYGYNVTEWSFMCWCALKKLLTHSLTQLQYHHHCLCSCSVPITLFHKVSEQSNFTDCWQSSCTCYLIVMLRLQCIVILLKPRLPAPVILILFVFRVLAHLSKSNSRTFQGPYKGYISEGARIEASKAPR